MGKVLRLPLSKDKKPALADAKEIIPEQSDASIETYFVSRSGIYLTKSRLLVLYQVGGPNELRVFDLVDGRAKPNGKVDALPVSTVEAVEPLDGDTAIFRTTVLPHAHGSRSI